MGDYKPGQRCGWCIDGNHTMCVVAVPMKGGLWRCDCREETPHPKTRCLVCGRRGVDTDPNCQCADGDDCATYRKTKHSHLITAHERAAKERSTPAEAEVVRALGVKPRPCQCCGETTKGGLFRPGHDARWVSRLVTAVLEGSVTLDEARHTIATLDSAPLMVKFDRAHQKKVKHA